MEDFTQLNQALFDVARPQESELHKAHGLPPEVARYAAATAAIKILEQVKKSIPTAVLNQGSPATLPAAHAAPWGVVEFKNYTPPGTWNLPQELEQAKKNIDARIKAFKEDPDNKQTFYEKKAADPEKDRNFALKVTITG